MDYVSEGHYLLEAVIYSISTGQPLYFSIRQRWLGDIECLEPEESLSWGGKCTTPMRTQKT